MNHSSFNAVLKIRVIAVLVIISIGLVGCTTYIMPTARPVNHEQLLGKFVYDDGEYERFEVSLFEDGYFHEYTYYYDDDEYFSDTGTFFLDETGTEVDFFYAGDTPKWNFSTSISTDYNSLYDDDYNLVRETVSKPIPNLVKNEEIPGTYVLSYISDERIIIELTLYAYGRFKEQSIYPDSEEIWTEQGAYSFSIPSGYIFFEYDDWPEGAFSGILDAASGLLHCIEGDYQKLEQKIDSDSTNISA